MQPVLVISKHELFAKGIVRLLQARGFEAVTVDAREEELLRRVFEILPRIVLIEDDDADNAFHTMLSWFLSSNSDVGVIRIRIQSNRLNIYSSREMVAREPDQLFDAIDELIGPVDRRAAQM